MKALPDPCLMKEPRSEEGQGTACSQRRINELSEESIPFWQLTPAIEFVCWVIVVIAVMLYLVNGPPVTSDQAVVQISFVSLAVVGAVSMRVVNIRNSKRWEELLSTQAEEGEQ